MAPPPSLPFPVGPPHGGSRRARRQLAEGLERSVERAEHPSTGISAAFPVERPAVLAARDELIAMARVLRGDGAVHAEGVALVRELLRDSAGPLYRPPDPAALLDAVRAARRALGA